MGLLMPASEENPDITHRTMNAVVWMFSGNAVQIFLQFLLLIILARLLTPTDFGIISAAFVVINFSEIFSQLGIGPALVQRQNITENHIRTGFTFSISLGLFFGIMVWVLSPVISNLFKMAELTTVLRYLSLLFPLHSVSVVAESLLQRQFRFRTISVINVVSFGMGYGAVGMCMAYWKFGVFALVFANISRAFLKAFLFLYYERHTKRLLIETNSLKQLMFFGCGFTTARIFNFVALNTDQFVVGRWLGPVALGLYGRAYQMMTIPATVFGHVLDKVLFPAMAQVQNESTRLKSAYINGIKLISIVVLPSSFMVLILSPEIVNFLFGAKWHGIVVPFQVLAVGMLFRTSYKISDSLVRAKGAVYQRAWRQAIYALSAFIGAFVGQHWGLFGVALGILASIIVNFILMAHLSMSLIQMKWRTFLSVHLPSLIFTVLSMCLLGPVVSILRASGLSSFVILLLSSLSFLLIALIILILRPFYFIGSREITVVKKFLANLPFGTQFFKAANRIYRAAHA